MTNTLPVIAPLDGASDGDADGEGGGAIGEGATGETAIGESAAGDGESATGEGAGAEAEGLSATVDVAPGLGPQPAPSIRAATAIPAQRCMPLVLVLSNGADTVRLRADASNSGPILSV